MRTEVVLGAAVAGVTVLVVLLLALLWSDARLDANEAEVVARVRATRAEIIAATRAQSDAEAIAARYVATGAGVLLDEYALAGRETRARLAAAAGQVRRDPELFARVGSLSGLVGRRLDALDGEVAAHSEGAGPALPGTGFYATFRAESDAVQQLLNARIDVARLAQDRVRDRLDMVTVLLGLLSLLASGLAVLALRRERGQWRLAQAATDAARARAQESDLAKTRFLAVASHDMRQPLHALTLYLGALERRVQSAEALDIVRKMERATQSMVGMFATLLDLARIQSGAVEPRIQDVPVQDVIDRIVAEHPGGSVEASSTAVVIRSDPLLLERVLANLVVNAIKHGGGKARIEVRDAGERARITVADDGPGIPAADQQRIFDEFVRLEGRNGAEGLGLGLAIVARITDLLGMPLVLESVPGQGARFTVTAPRVVAAATTERRVSRAPVALRGAAVIVCDDDALAREAIAGAMRDLGAEVRSCGNEAGLAALVDAGRPPDLLVTDLRLDGELCGIDLAARLRARLSPPPGVIIVTGDTGPDTLVRLQAAGHPWLIKPVDSATLGAAAAAVLRGGRTGVASATDRGAVAADG